MAAIFDIGSGSIGGALVAIDGAEPPEILFAARRELPFQEKLSFQRFLEAMEKTLEELAVSVQKASGKVRIDEAFCILASPWYASQTRLIRYSQEAPFTVTEKGLAKLIEKEIAQFRDSKLFARSKVGDAPPDIMEAKSMQIKLNGYDVRDPFGKKVSELELAAYISMLPPNIRRVIETAIKKFWHVPHVRFSSFSFSAFDTIRSIFPDEPSFLFMDISSEVTDISLAKDNILLESISFPYGKNALVRTLVDAMKTTPALAFSELERYAEKRSTPERAKEIEEILGETTKRWSGFLEDALTRFAAEFPIPRTIFYTADDDVVEWFERAINDARIVRFAAAEDGFTVRSLGHAFLGKFIRSQDEHFSDPFLSIEGLYAKKILSLKN